MSDRRALLPLAACLALAAWSCSTSPFSSKTDANWKQSSAGVADDDLARLCSDAWEHQMRSSPTWASYLGDPRYHGALEDNSLAGQQRQAGVLREFVRRAEALDVLGLNSTDRVTLQMLYAGWQVELAEFELGIDVASWNIDPRGGPQNDLLTLASDQPLATAREREQLLERWSAMPLLLDRTCANLRRGLSSGRVTSRQAARATLDQLERLLATPVAQSALLAPVLGGGSLVVTADPRDLDAFARAHDASPAQLRSANAERLALLERPTAMVEDDERRKEPGPLELFVPSDDDTLSPTERGRFVFAVENLVRDEIYPAFRRYRDLLSGEILPRTRDDEHPGLASMRDGERYYSICIRRHTALAETPQAIHDFGLAEVARIRREIGELGRKVFGTGDFAAIQRHLRGDPALHFASAEEILDKARTTLARAQVAMPAAFGILPKAACEVVPIPAHEAPQTTVAYYREPTAPENTPSTGPRPGRYYVNTYAPTTRTRYEAEVLAFHEAIPGHHLQVAIAQELTGLPLVRRHNGSTAFVEGWALYTERLADELGLYTSDVDRLGMLSYDAWRSCRLVVDTGLHALGWSRQKAIDYMVANTLLAENNVENEVDRYIAWPGQALGYKLGQREILELRARAQAQFGKDFDLRAFHDRVLENGAVTLDILRERITTWIARGPRTAAVEPANSRD